MFRLVITTAVMLLMGCLSPGDQILETTSDQALLFVKEPNQGQNRRPHVPDNNETADGTDIMMLKPVTAKGALTNLTAKWTRGSETNPEKYGAAIDPEISSDGSKMVFAMRLPSDNTYSNNHFHIYEMDLNSNALAQLTYGDHDNFDPYYVDDNTIVFTSNRQGIADEYERRNAPLLHIGTKSNSGELENIQQISFNQSHDMNPVVHSSGKIYYCRWEHLGDKNKMSLFTVNPDGTGMFLLYGSHTPTGNGQSVFDMREMHDGSIVTTITRRGQSFEGGYIAIVDLSHSETAPKYVTDENGTDGLSSEGWVPLVFKNPHPIYHEGKERIIAAGTSTSSINDDGVVDYGLWLLDKNGGDPILVYNDPEANEFDPIPVGNSKNYIPKKAYTPDSLVAQATASDTTGIFFTSDVYLRGGVNVDRQIQPVKAEKEAKYVRVLEAVELPIDRYQRGGDIGMTNLEKQRTVGYGFVKDDGSFAIEVPANKSMHLQILDAHGMALVNQETWVHVKPRERRICTGCHDSHENDKLIFDLKINANNQVFNENTTQTYLAGFHNADNVTDHPSAISDTVDFDAAHFGDYSLYENGTDIMESRLTIQNIFRDKCYDCHSIADASGKGGGLVLESVARVYPDSIDNIDNDYQRNQAYRDFYMGRSSIYEYLSDGNNYKGERNYISELARNSPLMWVLMNKKYTTDNSSGKIVNEVDAAWDAPSYDHSALWAKDSTGEIDSFHPDNKELLRIIEWLDAGRQYSNTIGY